jgi:hypothetical protein
MLLRANIFRANVIERSQRQSDHFDSQKCHLIKTIIKKNP